MGSKFITLGLLLYADMTTSTNLSTTYSGPESESPIDLQSLMAYCRPLLDSLVLSHTFLVLSIPLFVSLFYFSTPHSRFRPVFFLNLAAIFLAFLICTLIDVYAIHAMLKPLDPWTPLVNIVIGFMGIRQSILVDSILLVRLVSVYPLGQMGQIRFVLLIATPVILKILRAINAILFVKLMINIMNGPNAGIAMQSTFSHSPYIKIDWAIQMLDNTYATIAFLWKLQGQGYADNISNFRNASLTQRLRTLSGIALTNFVPPSMFSIVQFVCLYRGANGAILNELMLVNMIVSTFGVAFATVWAGNRSRQEAVRASVSDSDRKPHHVASSNVMPIFRHEADPEFTILTIANSTKLQKERSEMHTL